MSVVVLSFILAGCGTLGERVEPASTAANAPEIAAILSDLAANDAALKTFRAGGKFTLEWPEDGVQKTKIFRGGRILFQRPDDLFVQGNHAVTNMPLFKLICVGREFLMEFPGSQDQSFYEIEGLGFESVPFPVSPSDIAREMFLPEDWAAIDTDEIRVRSHDTARDVYVLEIGPVSHPRRRIEVGRVADDTPAWVVQRNERLGDDGGVYAVTTTSEHHRADGVLFPSVVDAFFPTENTRMTFEMRNIRVNTELENEAFDIRARAKELNLLPGAP